MWMIRKITLFSLLIVAALFVQNASAVLTETLILPLSSYAEAEDTWQGFSIFDEGDFDVLVEFAVYDTELLLRPDEIALAEELDMPGQYIYAYQIFNRREGDYEEVAYFAIYGIDEYAMDVDEESIGSKDDNADGIQPSEAYFESRSRGVWEFEDKEGFSVINAGEHSYFLVFSSDSAPVRGNYEIKTTESEFPIPSEVPEPTMIALFGIGSALMMLTRRRKSV